MNLKTLLRMLKKPHTQKDEVLKYMKENKSISTLECTTQLFIVDLQSVIRDLRKSYAISYKWIYTHNRYGRPVRYKRYKLTEANDKNNGYTPYGD